MVEKWSGGQKTFNGKTIEKLVGENGALEKNYSIEVYLSFLIPKMESVELFSKIGAV